MSTIEARYDRLRQLMKSYESVVVAFSAGVDSTLVVKVAADELGQRAVAVTGSSNAVPPEEVAEAQRLAELIGIRHRVIQTEEMQRPGYVANAGDRCYHCKTELYTLLQKVAQEEGAKWILDGTNADDVGDHRPGMTAAKELGVQSPLKEAGITKDDVRELARRLNLPNWDKPAMPCLSSRIPYGTQVTIEGLAMVYEAENVLRALGLKELRVRWHREVGRIEVPKDQMELVLAHADEIQRRFQEIGFQYAALDLKGFRSGSLNEVLRSKNTG